MRHLLGFLAFLWAAAMVVFFYHQEGLIFLPFLPDPPHPEAYRHILGSLAGKYKVWTGNFPAAGLAWAVGALVLYVTLGSIVLDCFTLYTPRGAKLCLSLVVGIGISGVVFELLGMAGFLRRWPVVVAWLLMLGTAYLIRKRRWSLRDPNAPLADPWRAHKARQSVFRNWLRNSVLPPQNALEHTIFVLAALLITVICTLVLIHGIAIPETYWDSLILYMGYSRKMFLESGFPVKVVGQVGIGLGANYPHLFELLSAQTAAVAGFWDDAMAQLIAPVCGIASTFLIFYTIQELSRQRLIAACVTLLFCSVPYGISYFQYASSYSLAILLTCALLYVALKYVLDLLPAYLTLLLLIAAFAVHINYLMWLLWVVAAAAIILAQAGSRRPWDLDEQDPRFELFNRNIVLHPPAFVHLQERQGIRLLRRPHFWITFLIALVIALPWYVRNIIVTGNPVYAFFNNIFHGKHVNPDVMRSAEIEWLLNGDGIGKAGNTFQEKIKNSWQFFVTGPQHWKLSPVFAAFFLPGVLVFLGRTFGSFRRKRSTPVTAGLEDTVRFGLISAILLVLLFVYEYLIADFYLYQVIIVLPVLACFSYFVFELCRPRPLKWMLCLVCLCVGFAPGVVCGMMGFKLTNSGMAESRFFSQLDLTPLKNLFMHKDVFYRLQYGEDMKMFSWINGLPTGRKILTHENRHLLLDERVKIIHLDDWEVQAAYSKTPQERMQILDGVGIDYYLYVPNEDRHLANSWLGMDELVGLGHFKEIYRTAASRGSSPEAGKRKHIPSDLNVLYKRDRETTSP